MARPGPKSTFDTPEGLEKIDKLIGHLRKGHHILTACKRVGINKKTFYKWMETARDGSEVHQDFARRVDEAMADFEMGLIDSIFAAGKGDPKCWTALAWIAERRFAENWSRQDHLKVTQQVSGQMEYLLKEIERFVDTPTYALIVDHLSRDPDEREDFVNPDEPDPTAFGDPDDEVQKKFRVFTPNN